MRERPGLWRAALSQGEVWEVGGANAQDPQGWKRPWGLCGVGLRLKEQRGPGVRPTPGLKGQGTSPGSPAVSPGPSEQGNRPPLLSHLPLLISPASGARILSGLHFSSLLSPPTSYRFTVGFPPSPWASGSPTSGRQAP